MNSQELQTGKMIPIELPEICAPRVELLSKFKNASGKRFVYISAPAGCGKTVSTLLWLQKSYLKPIWLELDVYDNTLTSFYRLFCNALFSVIPQEESLTKIIRAQSFSASPIEYTIEVLSRISFDDSKYALVLDDFHIITNEEIMKSLLHIVKRLPLTVTVLVLSRNELPQAFSPLEESGKIAIINATDLAFKSDEIRRYFAGFGRFITTDEAEDAFSLTEGWAIAVNALVLSGSIKAGKKSNSNSLEKYIKTQVWDKFDEALRYFMMKTSIVDEFSVKLCELITGNLNSSQFLETLRCGSIFISRRNDVYRYHHLFLDFLRKETAKEVSVQQEALYQKAADYYHDKGDHFNTLRYFVKSGDSKGMAAAMYNFLKYNAQSSSGMSNMCFINQLPDDFLEKNPFLYASCAWYAFLFGDAESTFFYLDKLYDRILDIVKEYKAFLESVLFLFAIDPRYSFTEQMSKFQNGVALEAENQNIPKALKSLSHNLPYFHRTFRDFSHYVLNTEEHFTEFRLMFFGLLGDDYEIIESGIRAGLLYEKNLLKEAIALVSPSPSTDSAELVFLSRMQIAACVFAMGREEEAAQCRAEIKSLIEKENLLYIQPIFSAYETKIRLMDGDKAAAKAWLENYFITETQSPELHRIFLHFTTVRAYTLLGEFKKAQRLCEKLKKLAQDYCRLLDATEATVLLVILTWMAGKRQEAAVLLKASIANVQPYHFIRVFADEGKAILPILKNLLKNSGKENDPSTPGYRYLQEVYLATYEQSRRHKGIACAANKSPVKLSRQQKYMLELLAKGYKNAEIVKMTGLTINTIRSHTKIAYQKLEVNNAIDAILRARELELID